MKIKKKKHTCKKYYILFTILLLHPVKSLLSENIPLYLCTAANDKYYLPLINLIGSLHDTNFDSIIEIAVFNLGLTEEQLKELNTIEKVKLYEVEKVNPQILIPLPYCPGSKRVMPGLQSWKPVVIKQSLDMFPYVLFLDAGTTILKSLQDLFKFIIQQGYFFIDCGHSIRWMTTETLAKKFNLYSSEKRWILDNKTVGLSAGQQGLTHDVYSNYVLPMYELAKDIKNFVDDGTTPNGPCTGRHEQTLFSIIARFNNFTICKCSKTEVMIDNKLVTMHFTPNFNAVNNNTIFVQSRKKMPKLEYYKKQIKYRVL